MVCAAYFSGYGAGFDWGQEMTERPHPIKVQTVNLGMLSAARAEISKAVAETGDDAKSVSDRVMRKFFPFPKD